MNDNEFKNVISNPKSYHTNSFGKTIALPFISGVLGCSLVLGTCFGVPSIKEKIFSGEIEDSKTVSALMAYAVKFHQ